MNESPVRWAERPHSTASRWVALTTEVEPRRVDLNRGWQNVLVAAAAPRSDWRQVPALLVSMVLGAVLVLLAWPALRAPALAQIQAGDDAHWHVNGREVVIESGHVTFHSPGRGALDVATPHVKIEVSNGRVAAEVTAARTTVWVQDGEAVVRTRESFQRLRSGDAFSWPPLPAISERLIPSTAPALVCESAAPDVLGTCLETESQGTSLRAEAASYELGVWQVKAGHGERAVETWRRSLERFPEGVLHPEVRLALMLELVREQRLHEAGDVASAFEKACSDDPRRVDVARLRRSLSGER